MHNYLSFCRNQKPPITIFCLFRGVQYIKLANSFKSQPEHKSYFSVPLFSHSITVSLLSSMWSIYFSSPAWAQIHHASVFNTPLAVEVIWLMSNKLLCPGVSWDVTARFVCLFPLFVLHCDAGWVMPFCEWWRTPIFNELFICCLVCWKCLMSAHGKRQCQGASVNCFVSSRLKWEDLCALLKEQ